MFCYSTQESPGSFTSQSVILSEELREAGKDFRRTSLAQGAASSKHTNSHQSGQSSDPACRRTDCAKLTVRRFKVASCPALNHCVSFRVPLFEPVPKNEPWVCN